MQTRFRCGSRRLGAGVVKAGVIMATVLLGGCGGSSGPLGGNATAQHLTCATTCTPSNTVDISELRANYVLVDNTQSMQALASFGTGHDPRANVEVTGGDQIQLTTVQGAQPFELPSANIGAIVADAILSLFTGAPPYTSAVNATELASPVQFQFIRGTTTYSSSISLAPAFTIAAPAGGSVLALSNPVIAVRLTNAAITPVQSATLNCTDANGNTASSTPTVPIQGSPTVDATGMSYFADFGPALNSLTFTTTNPRGAIANCAISLTITLQTSGQAAVGMPLVQISGQRARSVSFTME